jgi:hypothetical protein
VAQYGDAGGDARTMISVLNLENRCQQDWARRRPQWLSRWNDLEPVIGHTMHAQYIDALL